jgi:hypothetical protein
MKHDLVDNFWLMIYPITLGEGKKLFAEGTIPAAFKVTESIIGSTGVILVNYERAGEVQTGTFAQNNLGSLSILSARADYRMSGPALNPPSNSRMD